MKNVNKGDCRLTGTERLDEEEIYNNWKRKEINSGFDEKSAVKATEGVFLAHFSRNPY
ncbi:MAG TPA: hypothetical protein IAA80_11345 [Candidatus Gallacutalibacter pullistercoris]|nr:hypothetical protein [Candidatus Gallacutalibacter pullistercoris]